MSTEIVIIGLLVLIVAILIFRGAVMAWRYEVGFPEVDRMEIHRLENPGAGAHTSETVRLSVPQVRQLIHMRRYEDTHSDRRGMRRAWRADERTVTSSVITKLKEKGLVEETKPDPNLPGEVRLTGKGRDFADAAADSYPPGWDRL